MSAQLSRFVMRLQKKISEQKSIQITPDELDLFVAYGGYRTIVMASVDELEHEAKERIASKDQG